MSEQTKTMPWTVYRRPARPAGITPGVVPVTEGPAVAVLHGRHGGVTHEDALLLNAAARDLLYSINPAAAGRWVVELLYRESDQLRVPLVGIRPLLAASADSFDVTASAWMGQGDSQSAWSTALREEWPIKVLAGDFIRHHGLPQSSLSAAIPAAADLTVRALVFPAEHEAVEHVRPRPRLAVRPILDATGIVAGEQDGQVPAPAAAEPPVDEGLEDLQRQITERARQYAGAIVVHRDGSCEVLRDALRLDLLPELARLPEGVRACALPWPAGTRAVYDPVDGVTFRELKTGYPLDDVEVMSRDLFVSAAAGGHRCLLGRVRRLDLHEKRAQLFWECRYCHLGATRPVSEQANVAEYLGHEAVCPDRDRMDLSIPRSAGAGRPRSAVFPGDPDWVDGFGPVPGSGFGSDGR